MTSLKWLKSDIIEAVNVWSWQCLLTGNGCQIKSDITLKHTERLSELFEIFKRVLARVLPPAGQIFEKRHPLEKH